MQYEVDWYDNAGRIHVVRVEVSSVDEIPRATKKAAGRRFVKSGGYKILERE
jgi:hypothetical protein